MTQTLRKPHSRKQKLSYGPRGRDTLKMAFQLGGFTVYQHARFFRTTRSNSYRILSSLACQRLLETAPIMTRGRPRDFYFLSKSHASRAIQVAAHELSFSEERAKVQYRLVGLPATAEHAHTRNEFYLSLRKAAGKLGVEVALYGTWGRVLQRVSAARRHEVG